MTRLFIEFPLHVLASYRGASNLDETLDDNITWIIGQWFRDQEFIFTILAAVMVDAVPSQNEKLFRYEVEISGCEEGICSDRILAELQRHGFEKGCTIKSAAGVILHADDWTADIQERRRRQRIK